MDKKPVKIRILIPKSLSKNKKNSMSTNLVSERRNVSQAYSNKFTTALILMPDISCKLFLFSLLKVLLHKRK